MNAKVENMRDEALIDDTYKYLTQVNGKNFGASIEKLYDPKFVKEHLDNNFASARSLLSAFVGDQSRQAAQIEKQKKVTEDNTMRDIFKTSSNPDGSFRYGEGLAKLKIAYRGGRVDLETYQKAETNWNKNLWSTKDDVRLKAWIDSECSDDRIPTNADIHSKIWGEAKPEPFIAYRDKNRADIEKYSGTKDATEYVKAKLNAVALEVEITDVDLAKKIRARIPDLVEDTKDWAQIEGLTLFDPRVRKEVRRMTESTVKLDTGKVVKAGGPEDTEWFEGDTQPRFMWGEPFHSPSGEKKEAEGKYINRQDISKEALEQLGGNKERYPKDEVDYIMSLLGQVTK